MLIRYLYLRKAYPSRVDLAKYDQPYCLGVIKFLSIKQEFRSKIILSNFPLSEKVIISLRVKKKVNLDEDSDIDVRSNIFNYIERPQEEVETSSPLRPRRGKAGKVISNRVQLSPYENNNHAQDLLKLDDTIYSSYGKTQREGNKSYNAVYIGSSKEPKTNYKVYYNEDINSNTENTNKNNIGGE